MEKEARTGVTHPLGPCTESAETQIPECVFEALLAVTAMLGKSRSEVVREAVVDRLFGKIVQFPPAARSLDGALEGLALISGKTKSDYIHGVLVAHVFGEVHVMKYGEVGSDAIPGQIPDYRQRNRGAKQASTKVGSEG